jgi:broad specificity phosphatase PhoE
MLVREEVAPMARTIVLLRHTDNDGDVLSDDGVTTAVALGHGLEGPFQLAVSTGAQRATQTIGCLLAGMGIQVPGGVVVETGLRSDSDVEDRWRAAYHQAGGGELDDFLRVAPDLVAAESATLAAALERVADRLDDGERALVVGHSPTNEAAVYGLTGQKIPSLGKGEGVEITIARDQVTVTPMRPAP